MLGIPAIAVSQQADHGEMDFRAARRLGARGLRAGRGVRRAHGRGARARADARRHAAERQLPGRRGRAARAPCRLGKRIYSDRMELTEEEDGRRRYRIYGERPGYQHEDGTDFAAMADGCIAVTPLHFDLTDQAGVEELAGFDLDRLLEPGRARGVSRPPADSARPSCGGRSSTTTTATTSSTTRRSRTPSTTRC